MLQTLAVTIVLNVLFAVVDDQIVDLDCSAVACGRPIRIVGVIHSNIVAPDFFVSE